MTPAAAIPVFLVSIAVMLAASAAFGVIVQLLGTAGFANEWVLTAVGAGIGAFVASEFAVSFREWQPVFDGLALIPALVGGLLAGGAVAAATRYVTSSQHAPQAI